MKVPGREFSCLFDTQVILGRVSQEMDKIPTGKQAVEAPYICVMCFPDLIFVAVQMSQFRRISSSSLIFTC